MHRFPAFRRFRLQQWLVWIGAAALLDGASAAFFYQFALSRTGPVAARTMVSGLPPEEARESAGDAGPAGDESSSAPIDAAAVFCHGPGERLGLDAITVDRLAYAAELYRTGRAARIIGIGCHWNQPGHVPDAMQRILVAEGVAPEDALYDRDSHDTVSNVRALVSIAREQGLQRIAAISEPMHLLRIQYLWKKLAEGAPAELVFRAFVPEREQGAWSSLANAHHEAAAWLVYAVLPGETHAETLRSLRQ